MVAACPLPSKGVEEALMTRNVLICSADDPRDKRGKLIHVCEIANRPGLAEMISFLGILMVGFFYAWDNGALEWQ